MRISAKQAGRTSKSWRTAMRIVVLTLCAGVLLGFPTMLERAGPSPQARPIDDEPTAEQDAGHAVAPTSAPTTLAARPDVVVSVDRQRPAGVSQLSVGATHTQRSLDTWGDPEAVARGKDLLRRAVSFQNQHIMGFGAPNPMPRPGVYEWDGLDQRVELMRDTGGTPTITLCCAPDWMKGGKPGATDWETIERAPRPEHYADFAELARQVALRYPDIKHYLVWNELKGFWDAESNNWDIRAYTELYNQVYDALKSVSPDIQVGGPYLVIEGTGSETGAWWATRPISARNRAVLEYWLSHKHGADFIVLDRSVKSSHDTNQYSEAEYLAFTALFADIARQVRALTGLPIWWAESYFVSNKGSAQFEAAGIASMLYQQLRVGSIVSMCWAPQARPSRAGAQHLFTDTLESDGGRPLPAFYVYQTFRDDFGRGTQLYAASSSSEDVKVLASSSKILLINQRPGPLLISVNGAPVQLAGYAVQVLAL